MRNFRLRGRAPNILLNFARHRHRIPPSLISGIVFVQFEAEIILTPRCTRGVTLAAIHVDLSFTIVDTSLKLLLALLDPLTGLMAGMVVH